MVMITTTMAMVNIVRRLKEIMKANLLTRKKRSLTLAKRAEKALTREGLTIQTTPKAKAIQVPKHLRVVAKKAKVEGGRRGVITA